MRTELPAQHARIVFLDRDTLPPSVRLRSLEFQHEWSVLDGVSEPKCCRDLPMLTLSLPTRRPCNARRLKLRRDFASWRWLQPAPTMSTWALARRTGSSFRTSAATPFTPSPSIRSHSFLRFGEISLLTALLTTGRWSEAGQFCYFDHPLDDGRIDAWRYRRWRHRSCGRRHWPRLWNDGAVFFLQRHDRNGAALTPSNVLARDERRDHTPRAAVGLDSQHD